MQWRRHSRARFASGSSPNPWQIVKGTKSARPEAVFPRPLLTVAIFSLPFSSGQTMADKQAAFLYAVVYAHKRKKGDSTSLDRDWYPCERNERLVSLVRNLRNSHKIIDVSIMWRPHSRGGRGRGWGGLGKSDIVRELRKGGCAKMRMRRSKLKKSDNFADVKKWKAPNSEQNQPNIEIWACSFFL